MTEKRFTVYGKEIVQDNECWAVAYSEYNADVIATALNELIEENSKLHIQNDFLKDENRHMRDLVNENKQLKDDVYDWKANAEDYLKLGKSLKKENEQLKQENKKLKCINKQVEDRLENSGIGIALDMGECE